MKNVSHVILLINICAAKIKVDICTSQYNTCPCISDIALSLIKAKTYVHIVTQDLPFFAIVLQLMKKSEEKIAAEKQWAEEKTKVLCDHVLAED